MNRLYFLFLFTLISCSNPNQIGVVKNSDDLSLKLTTFINQYVDESYESLDSIFSDSIHISLNNRTYNSISKLESGLKLYHNVYSDILIDNGKIIAIGQNLETPKSFSIIDASDKHITSGIVDEHSHMAASSINEGGHNSSAEVSIMDVINPEFSLA